MIQVIRGMWGLGDNIFQRPFVREISRHRTIYLDTPWPELYEDLPAVKFVKGNRNLRTQLKNIARQKPGRWVSIPLGQQQKVISYTQNLGIIPEMAQRFGVPYFKPQLDLPIFPTWQIHPQARPIALIRPVTVRMEWHNSARNPLPEYVYNIAGQLMDSHHVINVADISKVESLVGLMPPSHESFVKGELNVCELLALVQASDIIVGGVGWIVPAAIAAQRRAFVILGGQGNHNRPEKITAAYWQHRVGFAYPDHFCQCSNMRHECPKQISNLNEQFQRYLDTQKQVG